MAEERVQRRLSAILAIDVVGYSRLMGVDEAATLAALKAHRAELVDARISEHQGRIVKLIGDGMLVEFTSVVNAVACAAEIQNRMRERNAGVPEKRRIEFRMGINVGDIIVDGNDIYGDGVNVAARLESIASPGGISVSASVREHVGNRLDIVFEDAGEQTLRNISRPVRVYHVVLGPPAATHATAAEATAPECSVREKPSIAVLPFSCLGGDPEQDYFADGITGDIITDLSQVSGLSVVARNSVFTYKGKSVTAGEVGKRFNVATILEGNVRKVGNRVRISAQLINTRDGMQLWADRYDRDLTDIFAIQDEIAHSIVAALKVRLLPQESQAIRRIRTANIEAYQFYLRGRQYLSRHSTKSYELARRMFQRAIELDPDYAQAYAGVADCDAFCWIMYSEMSLERIIAASSKALDLDPELAEAHASRGLALSLSEEYELASSEFERAIRLDPGLYEGHYFYARSCVLQGNHEEAAKHYERAVEVAPDDFQAIGELAQEYHALGREGDALLAERRSFELAERELERHPDNVHAACYGAMALTFLGDLARAKEWAERALWLDPDDTQVLYSVACVYARLGARDEALDLLAKALQRMHPRMAAWARHDDDLASLRQDSRFEALLDIAQQRRPDGD
ncbi:adenylate/guanylate cyclase domain-containing protein [Rhizobium sp. BK251]|uniref:adenylate/guanylate cyclase domain-containing protein n=1 Tax=Rhizobium sp. BK251 TaxID=2512125 RepID=UPI00104F7499|nr:adenylate/guanylate cyclase domain-containing protein [Rhizobium sp. BK251]TCL74905.1 adenylate cyclase [Rhizobium sp. BK251]